MIERKDIIDFFDIEAEAQKNRWAELMNMSTKDRIRKCKTIGDVYIDKEIPVSQKSDYSLLRLTFKNNISNFKEGDYMLLHDDLFSKSIQCILHKFESDTVIYVEVYYSNMPNDLSDYYDVPLLLDRYFPDLRKNIFDKFIAQLPQEVSYWNNIIFNTKVNPTFENIDEVRDELEDTIINFNLTLQPNQRLAIENCMSAKDYFLIQGPPGTGKSFILALIILEEIVYFKHNVIVMGPNHMAINNALEKILELFPKLSEASVFKIGKSYHAPKAKVIISKEECIIRNVLSSTCVNYSNTTYGVVFGLTPHSLYKTNECNLICNTLIIDEAGQMTVPLSLMGMIRANKVIFSGDHKQLSPIVKSDLICDKMKLSSFEMLITNDNCTMLDVSFRMCEPICNYISDLFYDGKLKSYKSGCGDRIICDDSLYSFDSPIVFYNIDDCGLQNSKKEANIISIIVEKYLKLGLYANDIAVLTPFRAQIACIRRCLNEINAITDDEISNLVIETIDRMQGQEREVIILSLAAGDWVYMNEMAEFLYNPQKLNVALSRAKSKLIIIGNIINLSKIDKDEFPHLSQMIESEYVTKINF